MPSVPVFTTYGGGPPASTERSSTVAFAIGSVVPHFTTRPSNEEGFAAAFARGVWPATGAAINARATSSAALLAPRVVVVASGLSPAFAWGVTVPPVDSNRGTRSFPRAAGRTARGLRTRAGTRRSPIRRARDRPTHRRNSLRAPARVARNARRHPS